jgi:hypothetical protein
VLTGLGEEFVEELGRLDIVPGVNESETTGGRSKLETVRCGDFRVIWSRGGEKNQGPFLVPPDPRIDVFTDQFENSGIFEGRSAHFHRLYQLKGGGQEVFSFFY